MKRNKQETPDFYSGIFFLLLGVVICFFSWLMGLGKPSKPGPGFMPFFIGFIITFLSFVIFYRSLLNDSTPFWETNVKLRKIIPVLGAMVAYGILLERIGFILITFLFITFLMKYIGSQGWIKALLGGAISSAAFYIFFVYLLKVELPRGLLGFI